MQTPHVLHRCRLPHSLEEEGAVQCQANQGKLCCPPEVKFQRLASLMLLLGTPMLYGLAAAVSDCHKCA